MNGNKGEYSKSELIYTYELDQVLKVLKDTAVNRGAQASYEFYFACLDRIDILITEKDSKVDKDGIVLILRELAYFRPREYHREEKARKQAGLFT